MSSLEKDVERIEEVWRQLHTVVDPELDEAVTDMGFISRLDVDASNCVHIDFRLPTYWCAANFAFMMADDMRTAVRALPWVKDTKIVLGDHMYADKINHGIEQGLSFQATFGDEATGNLDELRLVFLMKAFQRRQEALLSYLQHSGLDADQIVTLRIVELQAFTVASEPRQLVERYLERRGMTGPFTKDSFAFVTIDATPLKADELAAYMTALRRLRANAEFNGALCRGLLEVRFDTTTPLTKRPGERCQSRALAPQS